MQYDFIKTEKRLKKELDEDRYQHTLGVMFTASALAMCHGEDIRKAEIAGLLHDCAKCIPNEKKLKLCNEYGYCHITYDTKYQKRYDTFGC